MVLWKNEAIVAIAFDRPYRDYYRILYREEDSSFRKREPKESASTIQSFHDYPPHTKYEKPQRFTHLSFRAEKGILVRGDEWSLSEVNE